MIEADQRTLDNEWSSFGTFFARTMNDSSCWPGDVLPANSSVDRAVRPKILHKQGMHAKAKLVPVDGQPYTGFFEGSDYAIIRLSDVKLRLDEEYAEHQKYIPSFAIKFLAT